MDRGNQSFVALIGLAIAPFVAAGVMGCVVLWCLSTGVRAPSWAPFLAVATGALIAAGMARATRSAIAQRLATSRLTTAMGDHRQPCPPRVRNLARAAGLAEVDVVDDDGRYAYTYGLRSPRVVISRGLIECADEAELIAVFAHEHHHAAQHDPLKVALARIVAAATGPVLPAVNTLLGRYLVGRELDADRHAIERCGRPAVAGALLQAASGPPEVGFSAAAAIAAPDMLEVRLDQLERSAAPALPAVPIRDVGRTAVGLATVTFGLTASVMWLDRAAAAGLPLGDRLQGMGGSAICGALWILGAAALWLRRKGSPLTHRAPSPTTGN
ncbi:M56 family metallopeptidase [Iamia sp.]|uniref:M56 family metallopeptidase n=1 Tax=Iamia sp. TaxID=2722710 RepID=UPI002B582C48|nr:M56 family metallopeptidase [Iamia sp.]HXH59018.1 M56 family metallopeptidase [Iamia sp.]